jgi:chromosome segregation ATPase
MTEATPDNQLSLEPPNEQSSAREGGGSWLDETASEVARLEELLRERALELQSQRARARTAETLVRDLMAQLEAAAQLAQPADDVSSLRARTIEAEIGRAEIQMRFDELLGHFSTLSASDEARAKLEADHAALAGRERGLRAALAESEESRDFAYGRAALLDHDLAHLRQAHATTIRELAETREQVELAMARASTLGARFEHGLPSDEAEAMLGERTGLQLRLAEQERAAHIASTLLAAAREDGVEQRRQLGSIRVELHARQADHREWMSRAEHLERELAREQQRVRELAAENQRKLDESASLREELAAALSNATLLRTTLTQLEENASDAGREVGSARAVANVSAQRAAQLEQAVQTARRALVSLQTQLRLVHDDTISGVSDATEPGSPLIFDEIGEP